MLDKNGGVQICCDKIIKKIEFLILILKYFDHRFPKGFVVLSVLLRIQRFCGPKKNTIRGSTQKKVNFISPILNENPKYLRYSNCSSKFNFEKYPHPPCREKRHPTMLTKMGHQRHTILIRSYTDALPNLPPGVEYDLP